MRLAGERVLVTGSTSGIGKHVALVCAREGARVAVHGRHAERGAAVVRSIIDAGGTAVFLPADLEDEAACTALVDAAAERLEGLTVLVNNAAAGSGGQSPVGDAQLAQLTGLENLERLNLEVGNFSDAGRTQPPHWR